MSDNRFRDRMGKLFEENLDSIIEDGQDYSLEASKIYQDFLTSRKRKKQRIYSGLFKRAGLIACMVAAIFITSVAFSDAPGVKAFSANVKNTFIEALKPLSDDKEGTFIAEYTDMRTAELAIGVLPLDIEYIPDGYVLNRIQVKYDLYNGPKTYCFEYVNTNTMPVGHLAITAFEITGDKSNNTVPYNILSTTYYTEVVRGKTVTFILGPPNTAMFNFKSMYEVSITSQLEKKEVIKIIRNIF